MRADRSLSPVVLEEIVATSFHIDIHLTRIPFTAVRRNAVSAPVNEDAEFAFDFGGGFTEYPTATDAIQ